MNRSRRHFLKLGAWGTGGYLLSSSLGCGHLDRFFSVDRGHYDNEVLIVGAGAAGLMAAYELKKRQIPYRIFEASARLGGRVYTLESVNEDRQFLELGAESFQGHHTVVGDLCRELRLPTKTLPDPGGSYYIDGRVLSKAEAQRELQPFVQRIIRRRLELTGDAEGDEIFSALAENRAAEVLDSISLEEFLTRIDGGKRSRAQRLFQMACEAQFGTEASTISAMQFLLSLDLENARSSPQRVEGGMGRLTRTLYERVCGVIPDFFVKFQHQLISIEEDGRFFSCRFRTPQGQRRVLARHVILSLPAPACAGLAGWDRLALDPLRRQRIELTKLASQARVFLGFKERFWSLKGEGPPPGSGSWLGDFSQQSFWDATRGQEGKRGVLSFSLSGGTGLAAGPMNAEKAMEDLGLVYRRPRAFSDEFFRVMSWGRQPLIGGSLSYQSPGHYLRGITSFEGADYGGRLIFAGEHTETRFHGTIEGALRSGQRAASLVAASLRS